MIDNNPDNCRSGRAFFMQGCRGPGQPEQDVTALMTEEEVEGIAELASMYAADGDLCGGSRA